MADGVGHVRAQGVRLGQILAVKLLAHQVAQGLALQGGAELLTGPAGGLAGDQGLAGAGGVAGIRGDPGVAALIDDVVPVEAGVGDYYLHQHGAQSLADAGGTGINMQLAVLLHNELDIKCLCG